MQSSLFDDPDIQNKPFTHDLLDATIDEYPTAFDKSASLRLFDSLRSETPWREESLIIAGRKILVPRLQCWMGDKSSIYGYSGIRLTPETWSKPVLEVKQRVEHLSGCSFNSVLLNLYRNGSDSVSWHADDEKELGDNPVIASVSFGCERSFQLKPKDSSSSVSKFQLVLRNGSILIMGKTLQNNWLHQVPKVKSLQEERINLTFRTIIEA